MLPQPLQCRADRDPERPERDDLRARRGGGSSTASPSAHCQRLHQRQRSADTYGAWYVDTDINQPIGESVSARLNAVYEEFNSNRDFYDGRRVAINPTVALSLGTTTRIDLSFEYNNDKRTIDRGVLSAVQGSLTNPSRLLTGFRDTFFGVPGFNVSDFEAEILNGRVEHRYGQVNRVPEPIKWLSDNGSPYTARVTCAFARDIGLVPRTTPVSSPQSNGMAEAFVRTLKRDYVRVNPRPDAQTVIDLLPRWIEDFNSVHPHRALGYRSPREYIAQTREALSGL